MKWMLVVLLLAQPTWASKRMDRFQLFTKCLGMKVSVEELPERADVIKLEKAEIREIVRNKLRAEKIYVPHERIASPEGDFYPILYTNVSLSRRGFSLSLELRKVVMDSYSDESEYGVTWRIGMLGAHGFRKQFILRMVDKYVGIFIKEWKRVNGAACLKNKIADPSEGSITPPVLVR